MIDIKMIDIMINIKQTNKDKMTLINIKQTNKDRMALINIKQISKTK